MYGFYDDETCRAGCLRTAAAHREAADLFPAIRKVFEAFDGKVFNCRLEKALQESTGKRIYVYKRDYLIEIYINLDSYRGNTQYTLATIKPEELKDGKRIPAAVLINSARERRENHLKEAAALEAAPDTVPEIVQHIKYFIDQVNKMVDSLPYSVRDMYHVSSARMY